MEAFLHGLNPRDRSDNLGAHSAQNGNQARRPLGASAHNAFGQRPRPPLGRRNRKQNQLPQRRAHLPRRANAKKRLDKRLGRILRRRPKKRRSRAPKTLRGRKQKRLHIFVRGGRRKPFACHGQGRLGRGKKAPARKRRQGGRNSGKPGPLCPC